MLDLTLWPQQLLQIIEEGRQQFPLAATLVASLWGIQLLNRLLAYRLNFLGIWPRKLYGIPGLICAPWLHGSFEHLFFNSIPLLILSNLMLLYGLANFISISLFIMLISGSATWLLGRPGIHLGASGVLMGYWGFLLSLSILQTGAMSILVAGLCLYYLGGLWLNLLPQGTRTSWEGHVFGCAAGVIAAWVVAGCPRLV